MLHVLPRQKFIAELDFVIWLEAATALCSHVDNTIFNKVLIDGLLILRQLLLITAIGWFIFDLGSYNRQEIQADIST